MPPRDPFGDWLATRPVRRLAAQLGLAHQAVEKWRNGGGVSPAKMPAVKRLAKRDGIVLTTDHLLPRTTR